MLTYLKAQYARDQTFPNRYDLNKAFAGMAGDFTPATTVQTLSDRLDKALKFYLEHRNERQPDGSPRVGFPRFKHANQWHSIQLRQYGISADARVEGRYLLVPKKLGVRIKIKLHRPFEGAPKTVRLIKRADGHWYALIVCDVAAVARLEPIAASDAAVGIDVGLKTFLTDSTGATVTNPRFFRSSQRILRLKQRTLSRRTKGSGRYRKAARSVAHTHQKIDRQRRDFHFKVAGAYVARYQLIVVEQLNILGMVTNPRLSKSIHPFGVPDAAWAAFLTILTDKAASAGREIRRVPADYTTQRCSTCGELTPKRLSVRTHVCQHCSFVADRDHNAALNILRAGAQPSFDRAHARAG